MTKKDLIKDIAHSTKATQTLVENVINTFLSSIAKSLKAGKPVQLVGFGTFKKVKRGPRKGRNPRTGEIINIAAGIRVRFVASSKLIKSVK